MIVQCRKNIQIYLSNGEITLAGDNISRIFLLSKLNYIILRILWTKNFLSVSHLKLRNVFTVSTATVVVGFPNPRHFWMFVYLSNHFVHDIVDQINFIGVGKQFVTWNVKNKSVKIRGILALQMSELIWIDLNSHWISYQRTHPCR